MFQDSFTKPNPYWSLNAADTSKVSVENGNFVVKVLAPGQQRTELYHGDVYDDANVYVTVRSADTDKPDQSERGGGFLEKG
jgi:hypothetical protein